MKRGQQRQHERIKTTQLGSSDVDGIILIPLSKFEIQPLNLAKAS
jgi:hypothetical protein